jgi:hypothetical protein
MRKENYTLLLNSTNATNRIGAAQRNYQYYINWNAILPKPENINQKYLVKFSFMCLAQVSATTEVFQLFIDFGGSNMFDNSNSKTTFLGFMYPMVNQGASTTGTNTVYGYITAKATDNIPVTVEYPNNSLITVNIANVNLYGAGFGKDYILTLEFTAI